MLVVVGGHSRNLGKTSLVAGLIGEMRELNWTAVKITQYGHTVCSDHGAACACETAPGERYALSEEYEPSGTDSGRFLKAGAARSFWLRTPAGGLAGAADIVEKILAQSENTIVESNSVLDLVRPDAFLMMLDFGCIDFKATSLRYLDRADALVVVDRGVAVPPWKDVPGRLLESKPRFPVTPPHYVNAAVTDFVRSQFSAASR